MEHAIIHSDLTKSQINPNSLLDEYNHLLQKDINKLLPGKTLLQAYCPVTGEKEIQKSFHKMGMKYHISRTLGNIYMSPCPSVDLVQHFYLESSAHKYWLAELNPMTYKVRQEKIILPHTEWVKEFLSQYFSKKYNLQLAEFLPDNWSFFQASKDHLPRNSYKLINILFDIHSTNSVVSKDEISTESGPESLDATFLFEALERSPSPYDLLNKVKFSLKSGGLCFMTCHLSSGLEVKVLGEESDIFVPMERINLLSFEGMNALIEKVGGFEILEFSTPAVLDIPNLKSKLKQLGENSFIKYILHIRKDENILESFQDFLQLNRLGSYGRLVLRKK